MSIAEIPFNTDNKYENPFNDPVKFVGYKTYKMKKIKLLKEDQYAIHKNVVSIIDKGISMGTSDKIFIEA